MSFTNGKRGNNELDWMVLQELNLMLALSELKKSYKILLRKFGCRQKTTTDFHPRSGLHRMVAQVGNLEDDRSLYIKNSLGHSRTSEKNTCTHERFGNRTRVMQGVFRPGNVSSSQHKEPYQKTCFSAQGNGPRIHPP